MLKRVIVGLVALFLATTSAVAQELARPTVCSLDDLVRMNRCELEELYRRSEWSPLPTGFAPVSAIL